MLLTLVARAVHADGVQSEVTGLFDELGGSIGRGLDCHMVLPDPDRRVSRTQARIRYQHNQFWLHNASTSNPMYVDGVELSPGSSQLLGPGDEIRAGSYLMNVAPVCDRDDVTAPAPDRSIGAVTADSAGSTAAAPSGFEGVLAGSGLLASLPVTVAAAPASEPDTHRAIAQPLRADVSPPGAATDAQDPLTLFDASARGASSGHSPFDDLLGASAPLGGHSSAPATGPSSAPAVLPQLPPEALARKSPPSDGAGNAPVDTGPPVADPPAPAALVPAPVPANLLAPGAEAALEPVARDTGIPTHLLGADPFSDLMKTPISAELAAVPARDWRQPGHYIPGDFNPLASGGVAERNTDDPLSALARDSRGLADVQPNDTIDSIYGPADASADAMTTDPAEDAGARLLDVDNAVDPLTLFDTPSDSFDRLSIQPVSGHPPMRDRTPETSVYFRPPVAVPDPSQMPRVRPAPAPGSNAIAPDPASNADEAASRAGALSQPALGQPEDVATVPDLASLSAHETAPAMTAPVPEVGSATDTASAQDPQVAPEPTGATGPGWNDAAPVPSEEMAPIASQPAREAVAAAALPREVGAAAFDAHALLAAFRRGAGLHETPNPAELTPELMEKIGRMLALSVQGGMDLLGARAVVKQEVRMAVTLINPDANNPLKFLPSADVALAQMFAPRMPGFMPAEQALKDAYADLVTHQTAMAAGTQAALEAIFERFNPDQMEARLAAEGRLNRFFTGVKKAQLWDSYRERYRSLREEIRGDFFRRLGADFHDAYHQEQSRQTREN